MHEYTNGNLFLHSWAGGSSPNLGSRVPGALSAAAQPRASGRASGDRMAARAKLNADVSEDSEEDGACGGRRPRGGACPDRSCGSAFSASAGGRRFCLVASR